MKSVRIAYTMRSPTAGRGWQRNDPDQAALMQEALLDSREELEDWYKLKDRTGADSAAISNADVWGQLGYED